MSVSRAGWSLLKWAREVGACDATGVPEAEDEDWNGDDDDSDNDDED